MNYKGLAIGYKSNRAYIYIWFSKEYRILYVGETNDKCGVIGRASAHVSKGGTLRERCLEQGIKLDDVTDFVLLSYELPNERRFISTESSYRWAVEHKVQTEMHVIRGDSNPPFKVISNVRYTDHGSEIIINKIAHEIINDFRKIYDIT